MFARLQAKYKKNNECDDDNESVSYASSSGTVLNRTGNKITIDIDDFENRQDVVINEIVCKFEPREGDLIRVDYQKEVEQWYKTQDINNDFIKITQIAPWNPVLYKDQIQKKYDNYFVIGTDYVCFFKDLDEANVKIEDFTIGNTVECEAIEIRHENYSFRCTSIVERKACKENASRVSSTEGNYYPEKYDAIKKRSNIIPGQRITKGQRKNLPQIDLFDIPEFFKTLLTDKKKHEINNELDELLPAYENLDNESYGPFFHNLIYLEESELIIQMKKYSKETAYFKKEGDFLTLEMTNLFESRPSIIMGDRVHARSNQIDPPINNGSDFELETIYEGIIHKVHADRVLLKFDKDFHTNYSNESYGIEFKHVRSQFTLAHHGIVKCLSNLGNEFLFPDSIINNKSLQVNVELTGGEIMKRGDKVLRWFNTNLNKYQKSAVTQILRGELRPMPYVIYGPPGTGKTSTLIEVILQLIENVKGCRMIVATQSNSAANLIVRLLIASGLIDPENLLRVVSHNTVERQNVPKELHKYSATIELDNMADEMKTTNTGLRLGLKSAHLKRYKIVVGTCAGLGKMFNMGFPTGYFTHVAIDEAGQCTEPDSLIPISFVNKYSGQLILAGDPMQMGPIVLSIYARSRGLDKSLLDRLLHFPVYRNDNEAHAYDPRLVTKLLYNYRSIPSILDFCSKQFYNSELIPTVSVSDSADIRLLHHLCEEGVLPVEGKSKDFGIYFCSVRGENEKVPDNTSWCNRSEAGEIRSFVLKLLCSDVDPNDIGIITPYHLQAQYIQGLLMKENWANPPKVGSVEEFQGLERPIILVSTVRTSTSSIKKDVARRLGFIQCPQRINVAISRARSLLLIFGDDTLLKYDQRWKELIDECVKNKTFLTTRRTGRK